MGGLAAALDLACAGFEVTVLEAQATPGGKMRQIRIEGAMIDAGPTVFTMKWVFDALFSDAGTSIERELTLSPVTTLARHAWNGTDTLDLFADFERSVDAIGTFAGSQAAAGYRSFCERAQITFNLLDASFIRAERPSVAGMMLHAGRNRPQDVLRIKPYTTLWRALHEHFRDRRLRQLFGRYATYSGTSPFLASATLMLIAHVERMGVYQIEGGMHALAASLQKLAGAKGAAFRFNAAVKSIETTRGAASAVILASGDRIPADAIVFNGDINALAAGLLGSAAATALTATPIASRSQSAITYALLSPTSGFELAHHNVFFSNDYAAEFDDVFARGRVPLDPTVYVCAQDRGANHPPAEGTPERLLCLINAPACGDHTKFTSEEMAQCQSRTFQQLARCGLSVQAAPPNLIVTAPQDFEQLFPATGGALYGAASHGWMAPFQRPGSRSKIPGLYLAGGSCHPGAGVPMATLSGRLAARAILADHASISRSPMAAIPGGTSTR